MESHCLKKDNAMSTEREKKLDRLVENGTILSYSIENVDENGNLGESEFRNTQRLRIVFTDLEELVVSTFCSGTSEDTSFFFD